MDEWMEGQKTKAVLDGQTLISIFPDGVIDIVMSCSSPG